MMSFITGVSAFISGGYGVALIAMAVTVCFLLGAVLPSARGMGVFSLICGSAAFLVSFLVRTYMTGF